jgi:hypothetical protein
MIISKNIHCRVAKHLPSISALFTTTTTCGIQRLQRINAEVKTANLKQECMFCKDYVHQRYVCVYSGSLRMLSAPQNYTEGGYYGGIMIWKVSGRK